ncbi:MAG: hypothetical protein OXU27_02755 [Candidatus Poribacteria bacterium]|nr:hypothetical protein [Candidatus Poribacteria bacterium]
MGLNNLILVVEDRLTDAVSTKILRHFDIEIVQRIIYEGNSYLQRKAPNYNRAAHQECGVFMLTDLDSPNICPPTLIRSWVRGPLNRWFFLRIAVMEIESWIVADRQAISEFLAIPANRIPRNTDEIADPKEFLVSLARRSRKTRLREALVPSRNDKSAKTGNEYNARLIQFVRDHWDLERAATASPSLKRTLDRISQGRNVSTNR